eukprot:snap_masked-scaffold_30-processed-gene-2.45-mRNA-1 protein AED:1.00 eAED:1.00 QI:0/0/0/0/1/1/2/0/73
MAENNLLTERLSHLDNDFELYLMLIKFSMKYSKFNIIKGFELFYDSKPFEKFNIDTMVAFKLGFIISQLQKKT